MGAEQAEGGGGQWGGGQWVAPYSQQLAVVVVGVCIQRGQGLLARRGARVVDDVRWPVRRLLDGAPAGYNYSGRGSHAQKLNLLT